MPNEIYLSLVLPCYNEEKIFKNSIKEIFSVLEDLPFLSEVIFIDDFSHDSTRELIDRFLQDYHGRIIVRRIFQPQNFGRGRAVSEGIKQAQGEIVGYIDIDLETPAYYIPVLLKHFKEDFDVVTGLRIYTVQPKVMHRWFASRGYNFLMRKILGLPFDDTEAGFKFFRRQKILSILDKISNQGWFWDTEMMYLSHQNGLKVKETPCLFLKREDKKSTVKFLKDSRDYFIRLLSFKFKILSDQYWQQTPQLFENRYQEGGKLDFVSRFLGDRFSKIEPLLLIKAEEKVLDIGCGSGSFLKLAMQKGAKVVGLDYSAKTLVLARENLKSFPESDYRLIQADACALPFEDESFDWVLVIGLLDYLYETSAVLNEISRCLKNGGQAIITAPKKYSLFFFLRGTIGSFIRAKVLRIPPIIKWFDKSELFQLFKENNLKVGNLESIQFTMWISKIKKEERR